MTVLKTMSLRVKAIVILEFALQVSQSNLKKIIIEVPSSFPLSNELLAMFILAFVKPKRQTLPVSGLKKLEET